MKFDVLNSLTGAVQFTAEIDCAEDNLSGANLSGADMSEADIDFSCWPLWCGSISAKIDERLARQLAYHFLAVSREHLPAGALTQEMIDFANGFHRIGGVPKIAGKDGA